MVKKGQDGKPTRRGKGEGTIYLDKRSGLYHGQVTLPNGKRKNVYDQKKPVVVQKVAQLRREIEAGMHGTTQGEQTLREFASDFLEQHQHDLKSKSAKGYATMVRIHLDTIGDIEMTQLKPIDIQKHYGRKLKIYAPTTVHHIHEFIHLVLENAVLLGIIPRNYSDFVKSPPLKPKEIQPLSEEQARRMLAAVKGHFYEPVYVTCLATGMREAELLGLRWEDIDFKRERIRVAMTLHRTGGGKVWLEPPKSASSRRTLPLPQYAIDVLWNWQIAQQSYKASMGDAWQDTFNLVFTTEAGQAVRYDTLIRRFRKCIVPAGLPETTRIHDLRHTFATLLLERGVPIRVVSELLGHSSIGITLDTYGHVTPRMREGAIEEITDILRLPEGWE
jgi:integrase